MTNPVSFQLHSRDELKMFEAAYPLLHKFTHDTSHNNRVSHGPTEDRDLAILKFTIHGVLVHNWSGYAGGGKCEVWVVRPNSKNRLIHKLRQDRHCSLRRHVHPVDELVVLTEIISTE